MQRDSVLREKLQKVVTLSRALLMVSELNYNNFETRICLFNPVCFCVRASTKAVDFF